MFAGFDNLCNELERQELEVNYQHLGYVYHYTLFSFYTVYSAVNLFLAYDNDIIRYKKLCVLK